VFKQRNLLSPFNGIAVKFNLSSIDKETADIPLFRILENSLEVSVGMREGILFISTLPNMETVFDKKASIAENPIFAASKPWELKPGNIVFVDGSKLGSYVARVVGLLKNAKQFSAQDEEAYAQLKLYLEPIEGFVQVQRGDNIKNIFGRGLLKIKQ
jgi:hypothetical protein